MADAGINVRSLHHHNSSNSASGVTASLSSATSSTPSHLVLLGEEQRRIRRREALNQVLLAVRRAPYSELVKMGNQWVTSDQAAELRADYQDRCRKADRGEFEAIGDVKVDGRWVSRKQAKEIRREAEAQEAPKPTQQH
jgi:hypothetical protein